MQIATFRHAASKKKKKSKHNEAMASFNREMNTFHKGSCEEMPEGLICPETPLRVKASHSSWFCATELSTGFCFCVS